MKKIKTVKEAVIVEGSGIAVVAENDIILFKTINYNNLKKGDS